MSEALRHIVPVFKLYGEKQHWPTPDLLHCEMIRDRSGPNDWHIPPHRHADLMHMLYVRRRRGEMMLEGKGFPIEPPCILLVPAMSIHGFDFDPDIDGYSITVAKPLINYLSEHLGSQGQVLFKGGAFTLANQSEAATIETLVAQLHAEYCQIAEGREPMLYAMMQVISVLVARRVERAHSRLQSRQEKGYTHLVRYQRLIERHYRDQPSITWMASRLGITATHLNTHCQRLAGSSAKQLLHERVMLEAKRLLTYTHITINEIAYQLGFSEPAYFTRFFKRNMGFSPKAFRQQRQATPPPD